MRTKNTWIDFILWHALFQEEKYKENGKKLTSMQKTVIGGAAAPKAMIEAFEKDFNVNVIHAWGMTEMSPLGTACNLKKKHA